MRKTVEVHLEIGVAAALLGGMSRRWVKRKIADGELEGFDMGNRIIVTAASVNRFLERRRMVNKKLTLEELVAQPDPA
jgi:hypothetical protein